MKGSECMLTQEEIRKLKELRLQRDAIIFESRQIINECADRTLSERIAKAYQWNIEHGVKIEEPQQVIRKVKTSLPSAE